MKYEIGKEIEITEDFEIRAALSDTKLHVKKGDKGYVSSKGSIHYTTGEARGKIQKIEDCQVEGYDTENIAKLIWKRLWSRFPFEDIVDGDYLTESEIMDEIQDILSDILEF